MKKVILMAILGFILSAICSTCYSLPQEITKNTLKNKEVDLSTDEIVKALTNEANEEPYPSRDIRARLTADDAKALANAILANPKALEAFATRKPNFTPEEGIEMITDTDGNVRRVIYYSNKIPNPNNSEGDWSWIKDGQGNWSMLIQNSADINFAK